MAPTTTGTVRSVTTVAAPLQYRKKDGVSMKNGSGVNGREGSAGRTHREGIGVDRRARAAVIVTLTGVGDIEIRAVGIPQTMMIYRIVDANAVRGGHGIDQGLRETGVL